MGEGSASKVRSGVTSEDMQRARNITTQKPGMWAHSWGLSTS